MSFGKKGLAAGQAASSSGGFGARQAASAHPGAAHAVSASKTAAQPSDPDEVAARRQAFIASERARRAEAEGIPTQAPKPAPIEPVEDDPLINLRNMSRPEPRPARPAPAAGDTGPAMNSSGMSAAQEAEIRAAARGMARNRPTPYGAGAGGGYSSNKVGSSSKGSGSGYIFGDPATRNIGIAYVLWFVLGQFSVHRFYCGQKDSAIMQMGLWLGSLVLLFIFPPLGLIGLVIWICWIVGDLFMIPGMLAKFKSEHDYRGVFA